MGWGMGLEATVLSAQQGAATTILRLNAIASTERVTCIDRPAGDCLVDSWACAVKPVASREMLLLFEKLNKRTVTGR